MIRTTLTDFTDEEYENILIPYEENFKLFIKKFILPEVIAFGIASAFERNAMWKSTLQQEYNSFKDRIIFLDEDQNSVMSDIKNILEIKYSLLIINDDPLEIKKIKYWFVHETHTILCYTVWVVYY